MGVMPSCVQVVVGASFWVASVDIAERGCVARCRVGSLNFACNSPEVRARPTFTSLELQRLWTLLNVQVIELHAKLFRACPTSARARPRTRLARAAVPLESARPVAVPREFADVGRCVGGIAALGPRHAGDTPW